MHARLIVIGAGTTGLCLALEAARRTDPLSAPVILLAGSETTSPRLELCRHDLEGLGRALEARHGLRFWSELRARTGRDPGWNPCGAVVEEISEDLPRGWARLRELGVAVRREGEKIFDEDAGTLDGERARVCLETLAREAGAVIRGGEKAQELQAGSGQPLVVRTSGGEITGDTVVLAGAGAIALTPGGPPELVAKTWTERCHGEGQASIDLEDTTAAEPLVMDFLPSGELNLASVADAFQERFGGAEPGRAGVRARVQGDLVAAPEQGGSLWVGSVDYDAERGALLAARALGESSPGEERTHALWEGGDGSPIVGRVPGCEGVWVACGFGASAGLFAPACAEGLAMRVLEETAGWFDDESYDPARPAVNWPSRSR